MFAICQCDTVVQYKIIKAGCGSSVIVLLLLLTPENIFFSEKAMKVCEVYI